MANVTGASLQPIYERLHNAPSYHPLEANTFADPSLEAGDVVTVVRNGVNYSSPVHTSKITWKKATQVQIAAGGNEERPSIPKMSGKKYGGGRSGLRNSEYLHYYVEDQYQQMKSGLELTTSAALLYVDNKYTQMQSGLALTASTAKLYVDNKYTQMQSGLALSTSTAKLYVDNKYSQMSAGLALSTSAAKLYAEDRTTRAYIIARINADNEGEVLIEASKVKITGTTTISGALEIDNGDLVVKKSAVFRGNINLSTSGAYVQAPIFSVTSGGRVRLIGTQSGEYYDITATNIKSVIKDASVSNNVLTLTKWDGNTVTFSKATTQAPSWSGSTLTVTAKQVNGGTNTDVASTTIGFGGSYGDHNVELVVDTNGYPSRYSATHIEVPVYVGSVNSGSAQPTSRYTKNLRYSISSLLQTKSVSSNGDVTPDSSYIGLSKVTVNVSSNPTLSGSWSGSVLTVTPSVGSNTFKVGFGDYGAHDVDLVVAQNGSVSMYNDASINVPVYVGTQNSGGANPTSRYTKTLRYSMSSLLQYKTINSNGLTQPDSGYIGFSQVYVNVAGSSITPSTDISINSPTWYNSGSSMPSVDATLSTMGGLITKGKQGYIYFNVTIAGVAGRKVYRIPISTI